MSLSTTDQRKIKQGVNTFKAALEEEASNRFNIKAEDIIEEINTKDGRVRYFAVLSDLVEGKFAEQSEALVIATEGEALQSRGESLWSCVMRALHRQICGNAENAKKIKDAIAEANSHAKTVRIGDPTPIGISFGAASVVAVAVGTLFSGPIAAAAAPVLGGVAFILVKGGVDGFCEWSSEPPKPEQGPKPNNADRAKSHPSRKTGGKRKGQKE
jgi:hypothetical protein